MRFVPILMLVLLMLGFASRPTVSAALSDGQVLLHPCFTVGSVVGDPSIEADSDDSEISITKCVSLGVLPTGWIGAAAAQPQAVTQSATLTLHLQQRYSILRPPRNIA